MATFVFKAMDLTGVPAKGEVEAASKQDVAEQLKDARIKPKQGHAVGTRGDRRGGGSFRSAF